MDFHNVYFADSKRVKEKQIVLSALPKDLQLRIGWGFYGGIEQFYIVGVDGTLAQLGDSLPETEQLRRIIINADKRHKRLTLRGKPSIILKDYE